MEQKKKIEWLSVLQGLSMLFVVIGHVTLTNNFADPSTPIFSVIEQIIYSFHMPLFMFISGWLFYFTALRKDKPYKDVVKSKLSRLGMPFLAFTLVTIFLKFVFSSYMKRPVDAEELINTFVFFNSNPLGEMWFIITLFVIMMLYPMYRYLLKNRMTEVIGFLAAIALYFYFPKDFGYYQLNKVSSMLIFFYSGLLVCKYELIKYLENRVIMLVCLALVIANQFIDYGNCECGGVVLIVKSLGVVFALSLSFNIARVFPNLFVSFRDYTFQIFLMGIFFQMAIRYLYAYLNMDILYIPLYLTSILLGIYIPVFIAKIIKRINISFISRCFGL